MTRRGLLLVAAGWMSVFASGCSSGSSTRAGTTAQPPDTTAQPPDTTAQPPDTGSQPGTGPTYLLPDTPNPVNAAIAVETENAVTAAVPVEGGTLIATAADGTVYTLTIPSTALVAPVTVRMTPIKEVTGIDFFQGTWIGVRLEPDGLRLLQPASLRMAPPGGARVHAFGFSSYTGGREFHGQPLTPDASILEMPLLHFSDNGARFCAGDCGGGSLQAALPATPTEWEARLQNFLEELFRIDREHQLTGEPTDPDIWKTVEAAYHEYWTRVIEPMLGQIATDCDFSQANLPRALAFSRGVALAGMTSRFESEDDRVRQTMIAAIRNCFAQTAQPCIDRNNADQMEKLISYMRAYQLFTGEVPPFSALDPDLQCGRIWTGTSKVVFSASGNPAVDLITATASFVFEIDDAASTEYSKVYRPKSGSVTWTSLDVDGTCTTTGGPQTETLRPEDGVLNVQINDDGATFDAEGVFYRPPPAATLHTHCNDWRGDFDTVTGSGAMWLQVPSGTAAFLDGRGTITGRIDTPAFLTEWSFSM